MRMSYLHYYSLWFDLQSCQIFIWFFANVFPNQTWKFASNFKNVLKKGKWGEKCGLKPILLEIGHLMRLVSQKIWSFHPLFLLSFSQSQYYYIQDVTVLHLNKTKSSFEVYTVQVGSRSGLCALRLNSVSVLHVEKEPNAMTEAWDVDQSLISKLKEQYRKERKGKKGVKSKCGQISAASCLIRRWSLVWTAPFRSSSLPPSLCLWCLRFLSAPFRVRVCVGACVSVRKTAF